MDTNRITNTVNCEIPAKGLNEARPAKLVIGQGYDAAQLAREHLREAAGRLGPRPGVDLYGEAPVRHLTRVCACRSA